MTTVDFGLAVVPLHVALTDDEKKVLWVYTGVGMEPDDFEELLIRTMKAAELPSLIKLAVAFPEIGRAVMRIETGNLIERAREHGLFAVRKVEFVSDEICRGKGECAMIGVDRQGLCWKCGKPRV